MLGAMRFLIKPNPSDKYYAWKLESFEKVKELFNKVAPQFVAATQNTSVTYGRRPNAIGKDDNLWTTLYQTVALRYYMEYAPEAMGQK